MKTNDLLPSRQTQNAQKHSQHSALYSHSPNNHDLLSIYANLGSIQTSLKSHNTKSFNSQNNQNSKGKHSNKNPPFDQQIQNQIYEWQAVYIEGKFYLSDKQTLQRYFNIENLLKDQLKNKGQLMKTLKRKDLQKMPKQDLAQNHIADIFGNQELTNLQTIKMIRENPSQKQRQEDESLLNNLDTSSLFPSRFTLDSNLNQKNIPQEKSLINFGPFIQIQNNHHQSLIDKEVGEKAQTVPNNLQYQSLQHSESHNFKTLSKKDKTQTVQKQSQYGYYLTAHNQKVFSKKQSNLSIVELSNLSQAHISYVEDCQVVLPKEIGQINDLGDKQSSLLPQHQISDLPIEQDTKRLKFDSHSKPISNQNKLENNQILNTSSGKQQIDGKGSFSFISKHLANGDNKKFKSLNSLEPVRKLVSDFKTQKKPYQTYSCEPVQSINNIETKIPSNRNNIFSNYENINFVDSRSRQEESSNLNTQIHEENARQISLKQQIKKLISLTSRHSQKSSFTRKNAQRPIFNKNKRVQLSKKYELPIIPSSIIQSKEKNHEIKSFCNKSRSIQKKFIEIQKQQQIKLFQSPQQPHFLKSNMQKSKSRLNGFIKGIKISNERCSSAFAFQQHSQKSNNNQQISANKQPSISQRSQMKNSIMTRNYNDKSSDQNESQNPYFAKANYSAKSEAEIHFGEENYCKSIGKIVSPEKQNQQNSQHLMKKDVSVTVNLGGQQKTKISQKVLVLRQKKQELIQKLQSLQKQELQHEINQIKKTIRDIQISKLNKMAKTIDFSQHGQDMILQDQQLVQNQQVFKQRINAIKTQMPEEMKSILKPSDVAKIIIPEQILNRSPGYVLKPSLSAQELQLLAIRVYKLFGIDYDPFYRTPTLLTALQKPQLNQKQKQKLIIKRFKNCVVFDIIGGNIGKISNKTIVWNFQELQSISLQNQKGQSLKCSAKFYIGGWSNTIQSVQNRQKKSSKGHKNQTGLEITQKYIYEGQYMNGKKHGYGKLHIISTGYLYEGQFIENHKCGYCKEYNPSKNEIYVGQFRSNQRNGKGYLMRLKQIPKRKSKTSQKKKFQYFFNGFFQNGQKVSGHQYFQNGDEFKGEYLNGMLHGKGIYKWFNSSEYDGQFCQNKKQGFGKWSSSPDQVTGTQTFYIGQFKNDFKQGEGKYIYRNGSYYQGCFKNDLKQGMGTLFYQDENKQNKMLRGFWKQGNISANEKGQIYRMKIEKDQIQIDNPQNGLK